MTWPFILNTVSPWPSVRKWLLILALNLPACQCVKRETAEVWDEGSWVSSVPSHCAPFHSSTALPPSTATPQLHSGRCVSPQLADKSHWWCVMGKNPSCFYACVTFPFCRYSSLEKRVEWQPDGSHNKTVIERYVIVTISS